MRNIRIVFFGRVLPFHESSGGPKIYSIFMIFIVLDREKKECATCDSRFAIGIIYKRLIYYFILLYIINICFVYIYTFYN